MCVCLKCGRKPEQSSEMRRTLPDLRHRAWDQTKNLEGTELAPGTAGIGSMVPMFQCETGFRITVLGLRQGGLNVCLNCDQKTDVTGRIQIFGLGWSRMQRS